MAAATGLMEYDTVPGCVEEALPAAVPSTSQLGAGMPGSVTMAAMKFTAVELFTVTRNDPLGLPGALPAGWLNSAPAGASVKVELAEMNSVTGTAPFPPEGKISTGVR